MPARFDHGFDSASAKDLQARLKPLIRTTQPAPRRSRTGESGSSRRCRAKSAEGKVRHPFFKGIREDL